MQAKHDEQEPGKRRHISGAGRMIAAALLILVIVSVTVAGTIAWLTDRSSELKNTFTYGDINIDLTETDTGIDKDDNALTNDYLMLPGQTITKDPKVTVKADSVDNWLFVKLEKSGDFDNFLTYSMANGWTQLTDTGGRAVEGVFYRETAGSEKDQEFPVIMNNTVSVKESVTKDMLNALDSDDDNVTYPTLRITAYAVQKAGFDTAETAWKAAFDPKNYTAPADADGGVNTDSAEPANSGEAADSSGAGDGD